MHISRKKSHQVVYTFEICLSSGQMERQRVSGDCGGLPVTSKEGRRIGHQFCWDSRSPKSTYTMDKQGNAGSLLVLVAEDIGATGEGHVHLGPTSKG